MTIIERMKTNYFFLNGRDLIVEINFNNEK